MSINSPKETGQSGRPRGPGAPTVKMIRDHAIYLGRINGRRASDLKPADYVEAKRDLTGETENDPRPPVMESGPDPELMDPEIAPTAKKISATDSEDEDEEGSSDGEAPSGTGTAGATQDAKVHSARTDVRQDE